MSARAQAVSWGIERIGRDVLMGYRGDLRFDRATRSLLPHGLGVEVWDCSGLACGLIQAGGGADLRGTHNAQLLHDGARELGDGIPLVGDLIFYGVPVVDHVSGMVTKIAERNVIHVAIWLAGGHCLSADGATWGITSLEQARASRCAVRLHQSIHYRTDCPYVAIRRNVWLDRVAHAEP